MAEEKRRTYGEYLAEVEKERKKKATPRKRTAAKKKDD